MTQATREPPAWVHLLIAFAILTLGSLALGGPTFSMMCVGSGVMLLFGILIVRGAWLTRNEGWISGAAFGGIIVLVGAAATVVSVVYFAAHARL